jgi:hypothetical protein
MKIKLFEEYNEATYFEIERDDFDDIPDFKMDLVEDFTQTEISILSRYYKFHLSRDSYSQFLRDGIMVWDRARRDVNGRVDKGAIQRSYLHYLSDEQSDRVYQMSIYKIKDEWYYLSFHDKCDQFDGLLDCLKMIKKDED